MKVEVVFALPTTQSVHSLELRSGATVADALHAVSQVSPFAEVLLEDPPLGIFGERVPVDRVLVAGDRVEIYRPLAMDPKEARRLRAATQKSN